MKTTTIAALLGLAGLLAVKPALAGDDDHGNRGGLCRDVSGKGTWTLIPAPNDPLGRVLGPTTGSLKSAVSAYLTAFTPLPSGAFSTKSVEVWAVDHDDESDGKSKRGATQDLLIFNGSATFTPIANQPIGTVQDALTLTAIGGTGDYAGATGTIQVTGIGYNVFGPNAATGNTFFKITYRGRICKAR